LSAVRIAYELQSEPLAGPRHLTLVIMMLKSLAEVPA